MANILVVEDEVDAQEIVRSLLEYSNLSTDVVGTAEEACKRLDQQRYQAIIIDLGLPGMDGLNLLKTIRANDATAGLPCMIITAYDSSLVKKQALDAGSDAYLAKPLEQAYFLQEVQRIMGVG
jgi:CheY-like chemotaxis protein